MIINAASCYKLNMEQFNSLFTDKKVESRTFESLGKSAADGNLDSIDMLYNIALRQDEVGAKAESILFDLFSGKVSGKPGVDRDIEQASLALHKTACNEKARNNGDMEKLRSPSRLLYMAGSAMSILGEKQTMSAIFTGAGRPLSQYEQLGDLDLWSTNRMLMTDEIDAAIRNIVQPSSDLSVNFPIGLVHPDTKINMLSEQISAKLENSGILDKTELFPINTGNHWVLFVLYNDEASGKVKSVVFNSGVELKLDVKNKLTDSAMIAGFAEENDIKFIDGDVQNNVPNGCGIFVVKAIGALSNSQEQNPVSILKAFTENFGSLSVEEQTLFNIQSRRQLYEYSIPGN